MHVFVVKRSASLWPFPESVDDCPLGDGTFADYRTRTVRSLGLPPAVFVSAQYPEKIHGPALVMGDDLWITRRALRNFWRRLKKIKTTEKSLWQFALPSSRLLELFLPLQDIPEADGKAAFPLVYVPEGYSIDADKLDAALDGLDPSCWITPDYREINVATPIPRHIMGLPDVPFTFPLTTCIAMRIRHWLHILRAGHLAPQVFLLERAEDSPIISSLRALFSLRLRKPYLLQSLQKNFVFRGKNTFIHPNAVVESSILGDNVHIGAHAYVVGSVLGANTYIEERAHTVQSTLGPRTFVSRNSTVSACVTFGDTDACINGMQACLVGRRCGLTSFAHPLDINPTGSVFVDDPHSAQAKQTASSRRSAGALPCGVAFGHGVFVGAGVLIAPGRALKGPMRLVVDPAHVLRKFPAHVPNEHENEHENENKNENTTEHSPENIMNATVRNGFLVDLSDEFSKNYGSKR